VPFLTRDGNTQGARDALLKLGLTHHLAFDFVRANAAYAAAFAHPPNRQKPPGEAERLETATQSTFRSRRNVIPGLAYEDYSEWIAAHLFRGLLRLDEHLNVVPETAAAFEVSPDGKCYRFRIDPAARWSDGTPVTAGDFAYTWARMRADGVETAFLLEILDRVEAVDDATLEVELHEPRSYALYLFAFPSFFPWPRHVCERLGAEWYLADPLVGNGPYLLAELDDEHTLLRASPAWHGPRGNVAEARIRFGSWDDPIRLWRSGELDTAFVPTAELDEATRVFTAPGLVTRYVGFVARRPPLDDQRVRRALAHALDRGALFGDEPDYDPALEGSGLIPPGLPAHSHDIALPYDPPRARELLAEAGFPDGHGLRPLRLAFIAGRRQDWLEAIAGQSAEIGVAIELQAVPGDSLDGAFEHGDVDLWWQGWTADYPDPEGSLTVLDASPAIKRDGPLDELLARARSSRDRDERWRLYREADRRLVQELVSIVPLWHPSEYRMAARPWIEGVRFGPLRLPLLDELTVTPH
jgi:oligopeptide transport system substrate-binding protein